MNIQRLAIIGGGVSGAFLSHLLKQHKGIEVSIFEKSRGLGGRCGVRRHEQYGDFKIGAQFFTNKFSELTPFFQSLEKDQLISPLDKEIAYFSEKSRGPAHSAKRYVGQPSMNSFLKTWAQTAKIYKSCHIESIKTDAKHWTLEDHKGQVYSGFDACVLSLPLAQGREFWYKISQVELPKIKMWPCWTLTLVTDPVVIAWKTAFVRQGLLTWFDSHVFDSHREEKTMQKWIIQASSQWSEKEFHSDPSLIEKLMIAELTHWIGDKLKVQFADLHRWRFASSDPNPTKKSSIWDEKTQLGYMSDCFCGGRVEGAMQSAWDLYKYKIKDRL